MRRARFRVYGRSFNGASEATVTIEADPAHSLVSVRPFRRRKEYSLPLSTVAAWVIERVVRLEIQEKKRSKGK